MQAPSLARRASAPSPLLTRAVGAGRVRASRSALRVNASVETKAPAANKAELFAELEASCSNVDAAPPSMRMEASADVMTAMEKLKDAEAVAKWGSAVGVTRRQVFNNELRQAGIKNPDDLAKPSIRNDQAFLVTVVGVSSVLAVAASFLPGDWGFFGSYLIGGTSIVVLAIGSTAPGLLQFAIDKFSLVYPDYRERVVAHEAAHFLIGYLMGVPVTGYSIMLGKEHTDFAEAKIQRRLVTQTLTDETLDQLAVTSMAGIAAEGLLFEEVMGQNGDLIDLQRLLFRASQPLNDAAQQSVTRWAVWQAATLLNTYKAEYKALQDAMGRGASVPECIQVIESAAAAKADEAVVAAVTKAPEPVAEAPKPVEAAKVEAPKEAPKEEEPKSVFDPSLFD